jgi:hypothetical protein
MTWNASCLYSGMRTSISALGLSAFVAIGCSGTVVQGGPVRTPSGLQVDIAISSATLGDEGCEAPSAGAKGGAPASSADCAEGVTCGSICTSSSVQLAITSGSSGTKAKAIVTKVVLIEVGSEAELTTLSQVGSSQLWNGSNYADWDGMVSPSANLKTQHVLSSPAWSTMGARQSFSTQYRFRVTVTVDGVSTTVTSEPVNRAPQVVT